MEAIIIYRELIFVSMVFTTILSTYFVLFINGHKYNLRDLYFNVIYLMLLHIIQIIVTDLVVVQIAQTLVVSIYLKKKVKSDSLFISTTIYTLLEYYTYKYLLIIYADNSSFLFAACSVISVVCILLYISKYLGSVMTIEKNFKYDLLIESGGEKVKVKGFLDTGNFARELFSNRPIVFINNKYKVIGTKKCDEYILTAGGKNKIELYEVDNFSVKLERENKIKKVYLSYIDMKFDAIIGLGVLN